MKQPRYWWVLGVLVVLGVMVLVAARGGTAANPAAQSAWLTSPSALGIGSTAPLFRLTTIDGQHHSLASLRGKVVILFAMFAGCADCIP